MKTILNFLLCMCLLFSQMTPFTPLVSKLSNLTKQEIVEDEPTVQDTEAVPETQPTEGEVEVEEYSVKASNFITLDMDGYCTLNVPLSHFSVNDSNCTATYKQIDYNDNKTRLYMSYITNMDTTADIPGYIAKEVAGVNTVTNDKTPIAYGSYDWVKIKADHQEDDCNIYIYYTLSKDRTSAFWIKAKVAAESDDEKFNDVMTQMLNTYYLYAVSGTLFDTPTTGYYENYDNNSGTVADTSDYQANSNINNVFQSRGGYVIGANISDDWKDLEIILDGTKFSLPSTVASFENAGFELNDLSVNITEDNTRDLDVYRGQTKTLTYKNSNGTVVNLTVYNDDASEVRKFNECQVVAITIDTDKFVDVVATDSSEVYNDETAASDMTATNAKDNFNHELILPGGITWGVYTDDLKSYYGMCTQTNYTTGIQMLKWKSGNKQMIIRTNTVHDIRYVQLSCIEVNN